MAEIREIGPFEFPTLSSASSNADVVDPCRQLDRKAHSQPTSTSSRPCLLRFGAHRAHTRAFPSTPSWHCNPFRRLRRAGWHGPFFVFAAMTLDFLLHFGGIDRGRATDVVNELGSTYLWFFRESMHARSARLLCRVDQIFKTREKDSPSLPRSVLNLVCRSELSSRKLSEESIKRFATSFTRSNSLFHFT